MKLRTLFFTFIIIGFLSSCKQEKTNITIISSEEMKELMALDSLQLIDVRSVEAFRDGHLKDAQNLVYDEEFLSKIGDLDKSRPVAVYCRTGRRSEKCSQILKDAGFKQIYQLRGGLTQWEFADELVKDTISQ